MVGAQAPLARVPLSDGTLVPTAELPSDDLIPSLLAASDVLGTLWFAAAANVQPGSTVVVVADGAVGLLAVLSARQMGGERIIAMGRHGARQKLAREFRATDMVAERGEEGVAHVIELTNGALLRRYFVHEFSRHEFACPSKLRRGYGQTERLAAYSSSH